MIYVVCEMCVGVCCDVCRDVCACTMCMMREVCARCVTCMCDVFDVCGDVW